MAERFQGGTSIFDGIQSSIFYGLITVLLGLPLSWGAELCQKKYLLRRQQPSLVARSFDLQCCCSWAKSSWRRRYSSCACLALACCASTLARASASDCDCGSGSDWGWGRRSGCTAAAASALHTCCGAAHSACTDLVATALILTTPTYRGSRALQR